MYAHGRNNGRMLSATGLIATAFVFFAAIHAAPAFATTVPGAPTIGPAWASRGGATIAFTAPASDGGSAITGYTVMSNPTGSAVDSNAGSTDTIHIVTGLTNGANYTFTVIATNSAGPSAPSGASNPVFARPYAPTTGTINNVVVFVRFSDQPEFTKPLSYYDNIFNSASNSLKNFYLENSYNTLTVISAFYPASSGSVISYQDPHPTSYYMPYDASTNPIGYQGAESTARETALVANALAAISGQISDELNLDGDNDGYVDHICFELYYSDLNPPPSLFNSRAAFDVSGGIVLKGKKVGSYTWVTAYQGASMYPGSTEMHEMGHSFGYPDLRQNAGRTPVGDWDVMSLAVPVHSGAYMKYKFTNWISNIPEITTYGTYSINDITQSTNNSYKIRLPDNEFLVLEYRKAAGPFESNLPGSGLCITRVNEAAGMWGNLGGPPFFLYYYRADGTVSSDGVGASFACLNAESGRTQLNDYSNPACFLSDGSACGISIDNIGATSGSSTTFSLIDPATTIVTHLIRGYLYNGGSRVSGATVTLSGSAAGETTTDNLGNYHFAVNEGGNYTITPAKANLTFSPVNMTYTDVISDQAQNFSATYNKNTISGTVTSGGIPLNGVTVACSSSLSFTQYVTGPDGTYLFTVDAGFDYTVEASKPNYFFSPYTKTVTNVTTDQVQNFTTWTSTVNLTGTITYNGNPLSGVNVSCPGANTATPTTTNGSGFYSFTVTVGDGSTYTVTPASSSYTFSPVNRFYTGLVSSQVQNFTGLQYGLTVAKLGSGLVTSNTGSITCGGSCSAVFAAGTPVMLTATPDPGWNFVKWMGDCTGSGGCTVTMSSVRNVTAWFAAPSKIGIFMSSGEWYLDKNGNGSWDGTPTDSSVPNFGHGVNGAIPVVTGGTGTTRIGIYENGTWYMDRNDNQAWDGTPTDTRYSFGGGVANAVPVTGDWTGTGTTKIGIYADGTWYLDLNGNGVWDGTPTDGQYSFGGGVANAVPVTGDWTGTGTTKIGIYADGVWYLDLNGNGLWDGTPTDGLYDFGGGIPNAMPVTGDWNGTGTTMIGIYENGEWYLDLNGNGQWDGTPTDGLYSFGGGLTGAVPVTGNW